MIRMNAEQKEAYKIVNSEFHKFVKKCCELDNDSANYHLKNFLNVILYSNFKDDIKLINKVKPALKKIITDNKISVRIKDINIEFFRK